MLYVVWWKIKENSEAYPGALAVAWDRGQPFSRIVLGGWEISDKMKVGFMQSEAALEAHVTEIVVVSRFEEDSGFLYEFCCCCYSVRQLLLIYGPIASYQMWQALLRIPWWFCLPHHLPQDNRSLTPDAIAALPARSTSLV